MELIDRINAGNRDKRKCPVCGAYNAKDVPYCSECMFDQLNPVFINREDARDWEETVVIPYKERFGKKC